ncbi:RHS repeat-associated core domain-containing protein [Pseudomonas sp. SWRI77]|uniref:RHS repeat-associated core domain-containing protein n=1 Tax=Pseudomonas sp. SWRI77 TaxID=2745485 RepID=UPI001644A8AE|nr:RHS repeat-associated core domain-containing protein [Pseudomonas sp. SWRI77]MBC3483091.1 hypothetical protein [Pseudomonas sp. SWRI77]
MSRFSEIFITGYNKQIIDKLKLKQGDRLKLGDSPNKVWFIGADDTGISVDYTGQEGRHAINHKYFDSATFCSEFDIEGTPAETISLYSTDPNQYGLYDKTYGNLLTRLVGAGAQAKSIADAKDLATLNTFVLIELKNAFPRAFNPLRDRGRPTSGTHPYDLEGWGGPTSRTLPDYLKDYGVLGFLKKTDSTPGSRQTVTISFDEALTSFHKKLTGTYDFLNNFSLPSGEIRIPLSDVRALYALTDLVGTEPIIQARAEHEELLQAGAVVVKERAWNNITPASGPCLVWAKSPLSEHEGYSGSYGYVSAGSDRPPTVTVTCSPEQKKTYKSLSAEHALIAKFAPLETLEIPQSNIAAIYSLSGIASLSAPGAPETRALQSITPYTLTTQADGYLPEMSDFLPERVGSIDGGWSTSSTIKAGRDLAEGEVLSAFLIDRLGGDIRKIDYTARKGKLSAKQWPKAFADHLAAAGEPITAGNWSDDNTFSTATEPLRLWSPVRYRTFSNAPFAANLVQALACDESVSLTVGQTLCLQVRDLTTQALYEHHFFTPSAEQGGVNWPRALCQQVNRDSRLLRAGVLDGCAVTPAESGNAFWVPQCAELCVTLTEARWWQSQSVDGTQALAAGQTLQAWVYDAFSGRLLAEHQWSPENSKRAANKWHKAWATALNASPVSDYLRVATDNPGANQADGPGNLHLWQRGDALRIFTTLPSDANRLTGPTLLSAWQADTKHAVLATVRHPFSHQLLHCALFKPQAVDTVSDRDTWLQALADFLKAQGWPEVQVGASDEPLSVPRFSELQVLLENVGDGETWSDGDYVNYLLETDHLPGRLPVEQASFTVTKGAGTVQVDVQALNGELEFRLTKAAFKKGYRVAACTPRASEHLQWPVDVTDSKVTWAGPINNGVYDLYLTYPETARDSTALTVGHIGAFHPDHFWHGVQAVKFTPPAAMKAYEAISFLCEDYGNTNHSEVFDTSNQDRTGVDERSGLFHAHYPIATLQGLLGLGPVCDLTLHYSALRANEAGLGDGWAWRFSRIITSSTQENDNRLLTLADGTPVVFSAEQWTQLGEGQAIKAKGCRVSCNKDYSQFTVEFASGRQEILSKPDAPGSDEVEPNDAFRKKVLQALKAIKAKSEPEFPAWPSEWQQAVLLVLSPNTYYASAAIDYSEAVAAWKEHGNTKELDRRIALYELPFVQLLPSRIVSQYGEALDLQWKRQNGQFLLMSISSGETKLFSAEYVKPEVKAGGQVKMQLWPGSPEAFKVELTLQHYLLRTLKRMQGERIVQQVDCGYDDDPTLDRVLCRLQEQDGSVECVQYVKEDAKLKSSPALPRVALHALLPGGGQQNHIDRYTYTGSFQHPDDQVFIAAVESGPHANVVHDLHAFGLDLEGRRIPLLRGSGTAQAHWLEFSLPQGLATTTFRYTGWGDELVQICKQMVIRVKGKQLEVTASATPVERQKAVLQLLLRYSTKNRKKLQLAIEHMLSLAPKAQRETLGKTVDATTLLTDAQGTPLRLHVKGSHSVYYCYYGDQAQNQIALGEVQGLDEVPTLECPFVPAYANAPLMAEYQCDDYGNPQGLKLYGYRKVTRAGRDYLELAEVVLVDGIRGTLAKEVLDKTTTWQLDNADAVWHQISTTTSAPASKKTPNEQSKVKEWSITNKQSTHLDGETVELTNVQTFIDNPTQPGIQVIVSATTAAGTAQVSKEVRSRHSRRALQKVEKGVETHWERDASGRITKETRYLLASSHTSKATKQVPDERIESLYDDTGKTVERTHKDGSQTRSHIDGLQRAWRTSWRRADTEGYVPLEEHCFTDLDESSVLGSWAWDYLPGGQAVRKGTSLIGSAGRQPWLAQESNAVAELSATAEADTRVAVQWSPYLRPGDPVLTIILAAFAKIDTENPLKEFDYNWGSEPMQINTIAHVYLEILAALERYNTYVTIGQKVGIADPAQLMKQIQTLAGLAGMEGLEGIEEKSIFYNKIFPDTNQILDRIGTTDILDTLELFAIYKLREENRSPIADLTTLLKPNCFEHVFLDAKINHQDMQVEPLSTTADSAVQLTEQQGLGTQCLSKRTTTSTAKADGTLQRSMQWADDAGTQHLQLDQHYDADGRVTRHVRTQGKQTQAYTLERDRLGRITKVTRPDATTIERAYHGFTHHICTLTVDGKVVATQTLSDAGKLTARKVGSREYGVADQTLTLPDKTRLQTHQSANGVRLEANDSALYSEAGNGGSTVLTAAAGSEPSTSWQHTINNVQVPGRRIIREKSPRGTVQAAEWQSLRGQSIAVLRADGHTRREFLDNEGRLLRSCQEHEDVLYRYDELGRLQARQVHALAGAGQWQVRSEHDSFNRETVRTFLRNGAPCFSQHMTWRGDGRMASKASYRDGELLRTERFTYDLLDRLASYACDAAQAEHCPQDGNGTPIKAQTFSWDSLDNLTRCTSTPFKGDAVTQIFTYAATSDPTRLTSIKTGKQTTALTWNSNGQLQTDSARRAMAYNAAGQLSSVKDSDGALLTRYEYDGMQRLAAQYDEQDQATVELRYHGAELIGQSSFDKAGKPTGHISISPGLAQYDGGHVRWLIDDPQLGIVGQVHDDELQMAPLLPFGEGAALEGLVSGYNGMRRDPVTGQYHAGNGYRCYDPVLRRHAQPDWLSPFGEGGINDYAHCPDPVNLHDPSGAIMLSRWGQEKELANYAQIFRETQPMPVGGRWRGLALSAVLTVVGIAASVMTGGAASVLFIAMTACAILSFGFEVASVLTEESNPELSRKLGHVSLAFAVASLFESALGLIKKIPALFKGAMRTMRQVGKRLSRRWSRMARNTVVPMYPIENRWAIAADAIRAAQPPRRGAWAAFKAAGRKVVNYLGEAPFKDLADPRYARMGAYGKALRQAHRLNNVATQSRTVSAIAWVTGKGVESYIVQGSIFAFIGIATNDTSAPSTPWGRYTVPLEDLYSWNHGGGGHLIA